MSAPRRLTLVLGAHQLLAWGTTFYLPAVIAGPAANDLGVSRVALVGAFSWSLLIAGACAPWMGRRIEQVGGRGVLATSTAVMALGLLLLAAAPGLRLWYLGWTLLGIGMALGLYDAAFATIGRLLGTAAGPVITGVTLIAGFASTVGWPLGAALTGRIGWRATLVSYAALQLAVNLPLVLVLVPKPAGDEATTRLAVPDGRRPVGFWALPCLASFFTLRWLVTSAIAVYVLTLLQGVGLSRPQAVFVAALIGPGQVLGRMADWVLSGRLGVLARARLGAVLMPLGLALLGIGGPLAAGGFALTYGMSNGILTINRGTLPMAIFGPAGYAALIGWLAVPVLLAQAMAPTLAAPLVARVQPLAVFFGAALLGAAALLLLLPLRIGADSDLRAQRVRPAS